ncbi:MAG: hypothetical protein AABX89_08430 [Candidatus Thermoplasmatota archaeon]
MESGNVLLVLLVVAVAGCAVPAAVESSSLTSQPPELDVLLTAWTLRAEFPACPQGAHCYQSDVFPQLQPYGAPNRTWVGRIEGPLSRAIEKAEWVLSGPLMPDNATQLATYANSTNDVHIEFPYPQAVGGRLTITLHDRSQEPDWPPIHIWTLDLRLEEGVWRAEIYEERGETDVIDRIYTLAA